MQKNHKIFTATDFVCDEAFLHHYLTPTAVSEQYWAQWLQNYPDQKADWVLARQLVEAVQVGLSDYARTYLSEEAEALLLTRILATNKQAQSVTPVRPLWKNTWVYGAAAACFLLAAGYGLYSIEHSNPSVYQQQVATLAQPPIEKANSGKKSQLVRLPDGSTVVLAPQSQLRYPTDYGQQNRTVYLQGEATFDVAKDAQKPFFVYAGEVVTKVLGTTFVVRSFERDAKVIVTVKQGQVSVFKGQPATNPNPSGRAIEGVLLQPNQQVVFSRETETFVKTLVSAPKLISNTPQHAPISFVFDETPVIAVFDKLKKAYGIDIIYNADVLKDCQLTASLTDEPLFQKLDVIVQSIDATYEVVEGQIVISANGCTVN